MHQRRGRGEEATRTNCGRRDKAFLASIQPQRVRTKPKKEPRSFPPPPAYLNYLKSALLDVRRMDINEESTPLPQTRVGTKRTRTIVIITSLQLPQRHRSQRILSQTVGCGAAVKIGSGARIHADVRGISNCCCCCNPTSSSSSCSQRRLFSSGEVGKCTACTRTPATARDTALSDRCCDDFSPLFFSSLPPLCAGRNTNTSLTCPLVYCRGTIKSLQSESKSAEPFFYPPSLREGTKSWKSLNGTAAGARFLFPPLPQPRPDG